MSPAQFNRRLSPEDHAFFLMDTDNEPMNIGSVAIFEGDVPHRAFVANIESKLHLIPRYTQLVVPAPLAAGRPTWEPDPHFDIHRHIHELWLDPPGSMDQLLELSARLTEGRLDRSKPLWEGWLVKGIAGGNSALVSKIHHCLVDGVGGAA
jgi:hypothetical protein